MSKAPPEGNKNLALASMIVGSVLGASALALAGFALSQANRVKDASEPVSKTVLALQSQVAELSARTESLEKNLSGTSALVDLGSKEARELKSSLQSALIEIGTQLAVLRSAIEKMQIDVKKMETPASERGWYTIKAGDTGLKIAKALGVSVSDLEAANPAVNWSRLAVGQQIKVPTASSER